MSNYRALAYHPTSGRLEVVTFIDTGAQYVVRCDDGASATAGEDFCRPDPVDLFLIAQEMAEAASECADDLAVEVHERYRGAQDTYPSETRRYERDIEPVTKLRAALSRWREFTNAEEKTDG